jgi:coatomer subunit beta'
MRKDFDAASKFFGQLPESLHNRVARFLENQGYPSEALAISKDDDHCFELATQLGKLDQAADFIRKICASGNPAMPPRGKWKTLGDVAMEQGNFDLAKSCFREAKDLGALFLLQTACGDADELRKTALQAKETGIANIATLCFLLIGDLENALQVLIGANRLPEAAFFARCYCPSQLSAVVKLWKTDLGAVNQAVADSLADPGTHPDLFPNFDLTIAAEVAFKQKREKAPTAATKYADVKAFQEDMNVLEKIKELQPAGFQALLLRGSVDAAPAPAAAPVVQQAAAPVVKPAAEYQLPPPEMAVEASPAPTTTAEVAATSPEVTEAAAPEATAPEAAAEPEDLLA